MKKEATQPVGHAGEFRAIPISWVIETTEKSAAVALTIRWGIVSEWHAKTAEHEGLWSDEWPDGYYVDSKSWIVKKDDTFNDQTAAALAKAGVWHGDFDAIGNPPPDVVCILSVEKEEYEGKTYHRAAWINPNADKPTARGELRSAPPAKVNELKARFQSQARAVVASVEGSNRRPGGAPGLPPRPVAASAARTVPPAPAAAAPAPAAVPAPAPSPAAEGTTPFDDVTLESIGADAADLDALADGQ